MNTQPSGGSESSVQDVAAAYLAERGKPLPRCAHALCQTRLGYQLMASNTHEVLSELNLELGGLRIVPDLCVYDRQDVAGMQDVTWVTIPPRMAVEIFSPSQTLEEVTGRVNKLLAAGVPSVWLVIPSAQVITIYQKGSHLLSATSGILTDPVTGISVNVDEVFA